MLVSDVAQFLQDHPTITLEAQATPGPYFVIYVKSATGQPLFQRAGQTLEGAIRSAMVAVDKRPGA